jgi:hypothetical protein
MRFVGAAMSSSHSTTVFRRHRGRRHGPAAGAGRRRAGDGDRRGAQAGRVVAGWPATCMWPIITPTGAWETRVRYGTKSCRSASGGVTTAPRVRVPGRAIKAGKCLSTGSSPASRNPRA